MTRDWLGLADDLTAEGVVGPSYPEPVPEPGTTVTYPDPPRHGPLKTLLAAGALVGFILFLGFLTPPGRNAWQSLTTALFGIEKPPPRPVAVPAPVPTPAATVIPDPPPVAATSDVKRPEPDDTQTPSPVPDKKSALPRRSKTTGHTEATRVGEASPGEPAREAPTRTDVDLEKYRNLTRGL